MRYNTKKYEKACFLFLLILGVCVHGRTVQAVNLDPASAAGLRPHKALYDIKLSAKKSSAKVANITGTMFYEWQPSCDAWVTNHQFDMTYEYLEVPSVRVTSDFSTYEAFDGKSMNFALQRKREGVVFEEIRGNADIKDAVSSGQAIYTMPEDLVFDLPENTLFPMRHTLAVLEKIKEGAKFYNVTMFDGSDAEGPVDVNSFILNATKYMPDKQYVAHIDKSLIDTKAWKLRLAFFPLNKSDEIAEYEISFTFHENGVISAMEIEYADFSVTQTLTALEALDTACVEHEENK